jgi:hypothetical protein
LAVKGQGQGQLLDAEGMRDALLREGGNSLGPHSEVFERWIVHCYLQV